MSGSEDPRVAFVLAMCDRLHQRVAVKVQNANSLLWSDATDTCATLIGLIMVPGCCAYEAARDALAALLRHAPSDILDEAATRALEENRIAIECDAEREAELAAEGGVQ